MAGEAPWHTVKCERYSSPGGECALTTESLGAETTHQVPIEWIGATWIQHRAMKQSDGWRLWIGVQDQHVPITWIEPDHDKVTELRTEMRRFLDDPSRGTFAFREGRPWRTWGVALGGVFFWALLPFGYLWMRDVAFNPSLS